MARTIAIGDIHGCAKALRALVDELKPTAEDTLVLLGDYVDRGPDARGVIDQLVDLQHQCRLIPLIGNHEFMFAHAIRSGVITEHWLKSGGQATLASYGGHLRRLPDAHVNFFLNLQPFHETEKQIFVHANYDPTLAMCEQTEQITLWTHLTSPHPEKHISGKTVFVGHTPQGSGEPLDHGHLLCLDTYCFGGLWLTAMDVETREYWQASYHGALRRRPLQHAVRFCSQMWARLRSR